MKPFCVLIMRTMYSFIPSSAERLFLTPITSLNFKFIIVVKLKNYTLLRSIYTLTVQPQIDLVFLYSRKGSRLGHDSLVDGMLKDGLWDVYNDVGMGVCAELCAEHHSITREQQVCLLLFYLRESILSKFHFNCKLFTQREEISH